MSFVDPTREQFKGMFSLPLQQPIAMLNLLRFREVAQYGADAAEANQDPVSGRIAYGRYSQETEVLYRAAGGRQLWVGAGQHVLVGPNEERWDLVFLAYYPSAQAFVDMVKSPAYQHATRHRTAGVEEARLIRCAELPAGAGFAPVHYEPGIS